MTIDQIILQFFQLLNAYEKALYSQKSGINQQHIDLILLRLEQFRTAYAQAFEEEKEAILRKNAIIIRKIRDYLSQTTAK